MRLGIGAAFLAGGFALYLTGGFGAGDGKLIAVTGIWNRPRGSESVPVRPGCVRARLEPVRLAPVREDTASAQQSSLRARDCAAGAGGDDSASTVARYLVSETPAGATLSRRDHACSVRRPAGGRRILRRAVLPRGIGDRVAADCGGAGRRGRTAPAPTGDTQGVCGRAGVAGRYTAQERGTGHNRDRPDGTRGGLHRVREGMYAGVRRNCRHEPVQLRGAHGARRRERRSPGPPWWDRARRGSSRRC